jgi:hypothetical protein
MLLYGRQFASCSVHQDHACCSTAPPVSLPLASPNHRLVLIYRTSLRTLDTSIGSTSPRCLTLIDGLAKILVTSWIRFKRERKKSCRLILRLRSEVPRMLEDDCAVSTLPKFVLPSSSLRRWQCAKSACRQQRLLLLEFARTEFLCAWEHRKRLLVR